MPNLYLVRHGDALYNLMLHIQGRPPIADNTREEDLPEYLDRGAYMMLAF